MCQGICKGTNSQTIMSYFSNFSNGPRLYLECPSIGISYSSVLINSGKALAASVGIWNWTAENNSLRA